MSEIYVLVMRSMVVLATMVFGGMNIIICGGVTFGVITALDQVIVEAQMVALLMAIW